MYKAFISYKSEDREWARKLLSSLTSQGVGEIFLDQDRLIAGFEWDGQLHQAVEQSDHLVVLWSSKASDRDSYVNEERKAFELLCAGPSEKNPKTATRRVIFVQLDADLPQRARRYHAVTDLKDRKLYETGPEKVPPNVWSRVIDQVRNGLVADDKGSPVGCVVLASTAARWRKFDFDTSLGGVPSLGDAIGHLGLTRPQFEARYGSTPEEWQPFDAGRAVREILEDLRSRVNLTLGGSRNPKIKSLSIRWEYPKPVFWTGSRAQIEEEGRRWRDKLLIVVIDPLSLYEREVVSRLNTVYDSLGSGFATLMVLGTGPVAPTNALLKDLIQCEARKLHKLFWDLELPLEDSLPLAGVNIDDPDEMHRLLTTTVGRYAKQFLPSGAPTGAEVIGGIT